MKPQVLVPLDGSLFSEQALPYACEIARRMGGALELVMVHRFPIAWASEYDVTALEGVDEQIRTSELAYLASLSERMRQQQCLDVATALLEGPVAIAVKNYARLNAPELIVMTTHGRGGVSRAWLGSVADELVRVMNIPTLLVRPQRESAVAAEPFTLDHILIPLDGSELSESIIEGALDLGSLTGARYTLMQVVTPAVSYPLLDSVPMPAPAAANEQQMRANAEAYLAGIAQWMRVRGFTVDTSVVVQMQCAPGILEQALADDVDLIAMATHGRTGLKRLALGSVADKVLRGTFVPVLLLRPLSENGTVSSMLKARIIAEPADTQSGMLAGW